MTGRSAPFGVSREVNRVLAELGSALATTADLRQMLQGCTDTLVTHLDAVLVRIWLLDQEDSTLLRLHGSSGCATNLDGRHGTLRVGEGKVGVIARDGAPCLSNAVGGDPLFDDQDWVESAGICAFAGHPLVVEGRVVGVLGVFSSTPLPAEVTSMLEAVSTLIGVGVERMRAQEAFATSEQRFRQLFDHSPDYVLVVDPDTPRGPVIVDLNAAACEAHGYSRDELIGTSMMVLDDPSMHERMPGYARRLMNGERLVFESLHRRKDGSTFPVEVAAQTLELGGKPHVFAIERDLTERKQIEREAQRARSIETLGVLAGGIAHDFNNLLTAIVGNLSIARSVTGADAPANERLDAASRACMRARDLTRQLLTFTRAGTPIKRPLPLLPIVSEAAHFATAGANSRVDLRCDEELWPVDGDDGQLSQVVHNLVLNAAQAMPNGGTVRIELSNQVGASNEQSVCLAVSDQGGGIPDADREHIFDPYFSTKDGGSGLGLATAYSIVKRHGGSVALDSTADVGTTVRVTLPAAALGTIPTGPPSPGVTRGEGRILVMDDEAPVLTVAEHMLRAAGYSVVGCSEGRAAVEAYRQAFQAGECFDAVILDLTVRGGMGGQATLAEILEIDAGARVIVCSGYAAHPVLAEHRLKGFAGMLAKPYDLEQVSQLLAEVLGRPRAQ